jgi:hypothetical protein
LTDKTGKPWMAAGETDDPTSIINGYEAVGVIIGAPVYLTDTGKVKQGTGNYDAIGLIPKRILPRITIINELIHNCLFVGASVFLVN